MKNPRKDIRSERKFAYIRKKALRELKIYSCGIDEEACVEIKTPKIGSSTKRPKPIKPTPKKEIIGKYITYVTGKYILTFEAHT